MGGANAAADAAAVGGARLARATLMRWAIGLLVALIVGLQLRLWIGNGSLAEVWHQTQQIEAQREENARLQERNRALDAEVEDLKKGLAAIEERARTELGMIRRDETFYQIVDR